MSYSAQDLFDYAMENEEVMDVHEIMEAMSQSFPTVADAFEWHLLSKYVSSSTATSVVNRDIERRA